MIPWFLYLLCFSVSAVFSWGVSRFAYKVRLVDIPNERSSHTIAVPKGGGIGILASFVLASWVLKISLGWWLPAVMLALVSFYDDIQELSPKFRLSVQFIAAILYSIMLYWSTGSSHSFLSLSVCLIFFPVFIVGTANYYNFMDGINGIAGITGVIGFGLLSLFAFLIENNSFAMTLCLSLAFACLGFLPFNFPRARVFMGDVGSVFLGFGFASMVLLLSRTLNDFLCIVAFLFPFYADELTTMVGRIRNRENLTRPHRSHLYQLVSNELGVPHWKVSIAYGVIQLCIGIHLLLIRESKFIVILLTLIFYFVAFSSISLFVRYMVKKGEKTSI